MEHLKGLEARMLAAPDQQISLTDPNSRSMATSGRGSGVVGYNVQVAVETEHHLIVTHEVTEQLVTTARSSRMLPRRPRPRCKRTPWKPWPTAANTSAAAKKSWRAIGRGTSTVTLPKPMTSCGIEAKEPV